MTEAGFRKLESVIGGETVSLPEDRDCPDCGISRSDLERMPV